MAKTYSKNLKQFLRYFEIKNTYSYFWFISAVLALAFIIPAFINPTPFGIDTYSHLFHVDRMSSTFSLEEYYEKQRKLGDVSFTYPFALWLFGSVIKKVTGLSLVFIGKYVPIFFFVAALFIYYAYSKKFLHDHQQRTLAILFLISVPLMSRVNTYVSSSIAFLFLISLFHLILNKKFDLKTIFLFFIFAFMITISHVGTLMFLINFLFLFFVLSSFIKRKIDNNTFIGIIITMTSYYIATFFFNEIRPQYIQKTKIFLKIGNLLSKLNLEFLDISKILYENIFKNTQLIYFLFLFGILYFASLVSAAAGKKFFEYLQKHPKHLVLMPLVGKVPKTLIGTPFWIGIPQTVFSLLGFFRVNSEGKLIFLTTLVIILLSGSDSPNVTRKIYYLIVIVPIIAALGFSIAVEFLQRKKEKLVLLLVLLTLISLLCIPVVFNTYFASKISGELYEREGLAWLSGYGEPSDAAVGRGFRHLIYVYGKKIPAGSLVSVGSELRNYFTMINKAYFSKDQNSIIDLLASYNVKYYVVSKRSFKVGSFSYSMLEIENKSLLDKIYSSNRKLFRIYYINYIPKIEFVEDRRNVEYEREPPVILDSGKFYLIRTKNYQLKLSKKAPIISYFGTKNKNYLDLGYIYDYIIWKEFGFKIKKIYEFRKMIFNVSISKDSIKYSAEVFDDNQTIVFDIAIKYIFFPDTFKQEITIVPHKYGYYRIYTRVWKPTDLIITQYENRNYDERRVFPAEDTINKPLKFNKIYLQENSTGRGIFILQTASFPYPSHLSYRGSTRYPGYTIVSIRTLKWTYPGYPDVVKRFYTLAGSFKEGESKVEKQLEISVYPFPNAIKPFVLLDINETLLYELNISKIYDGTGNYKAGPVVGRPFRDVLNYEGHRKIRIITLNNKKLVIMPICGPNSEKLRKYNKETYFPGWKSQIDVLKIYDEDICIFNWKKKQILSQEYRSNFMNIINYSIKNGFVITTPGYISEYFTLLQNVKIRINKSENLTKILIVNKNNKSLDGFTLKIFNHNANIITIPHKNLKIYNRGKIAYISLNLTKNEKIYLILRR